MYMFGVKWNFQKKDNHFINAEINHQQLFHLDSMATL